MWTVQSWYDEARRKAAANPEKTRTNAEFYLGLYMKHMPRVSRDEIGRALMESNRQRIDAVPSLAKYPELRGMRELIEAQWRGTRDGAGLDDAQAAADSNRLFYMHRYVFGGRVKPKANCSAVFFGASDHGPLLATNLDILPDEPFGPPEWPALNEHLVAAWVSSGVFLDEESPEIFPAPVMELAARYCRTTDEAVDLLTRYNHFWGPCNRLIADRNGRVAMIEKTACRIGVRTASDGFGYITAMTAEEPGIAAYLADRREASLRDRGLSKPCGDTRYWAAQATRSGIIRRLLDEARGAPTVEKLRAIMQYRGTDGVVCDNGDVLHPGDPPIEYTVKTDIYCLREGRAQWWARDADRNVPSWENRRPDVRFEGRVLWD